MTLQPRVPLLVAVAIAAAGAVLAADVKFLSTFKSIDAGAVTFFGKKVAALVITTDSGPRVSGEEALVRELGTLGMQGVATYRIAPQQELENAEKAKPWFERAGVEGVVALRPVKKSERTNYSPIMWNDPYYGSLWGYYGYGWSQAYQYGIYTRETVIVVENAVYSVPKNALMWAAVTESTEAKNLQKFIGDLVKATVKEMQKQGLAKGQPKK